MISLVGNMWFAIYLYIVFVLSVQYTIYIYAVEGGDEFNHPLLTFLFMWIFTNIAAVVVLMVIIIIAISPLFWLYYLAKIFYKRIMNGQ